MRCCGHRMVVMQHHQITRDDLYRAYTALRDKTDMNTPGVHVINGAAPGPTLGLTIQTHGNEPAGLAAYHYLTQVWPLQQHLLRGRVVFVLNNLEAAEAYWHSETDAQKAQTRAIDVNMNRLPRDFVSGSSNGTYTSLSEHTRAAQLLPVWAQLAYAIDFHTTSQPAPPMAVVWGDFHQNSLILHMPVGHVISNFAETSQSAVVMYHYGKSEGRDAVLVECGQHEDPTSWQVAVESALCALRRLNMTDIQAFVPSRHPVHHYKLAGSVVFPDTSYRLAQIIPHFAPVRAGQVVASGEGADLISPIDGHSLMCPSDINWCRLDEEAMFFAHPVEVLDYSALQQKTAHVA